MRAGPALGKLEMATESLPRCVEGKVGFFKMVGATVRANSLAARLAAVRKDHFDTTALNVELALGQILKPESRVLSGRAETALMGFQLLNFIRFMRVKSYISGAEDQQVFCGLLIQAAWMPHRAAVDEFCRDLSKCEYDFAEEAARVAVPVSISLFGEPNPVACRVIGTLLPALGMGTQLAVANEFGDKQALRKLEKDLMAFQTYIESL